MSRQRARLIGGELEIQPRPGFELVLTIPA
jgi:signal transduction histidine kinase